MSITNMATFSRNMAEDNIMREVNLSMMRNALDDAQIQGAMIAQMLDSVPAPAAPAPAYYGGGTPTYFADLPAPPVGFDGLGVNLDVYM